MVSSSGSYLTAFGHEAMRRVQTWLIGSRMRACQSINTVVHCDGENGQGRFVVAWTERSVEARSMAVPKGWRIATAEPLFGATSTPRSPRDDDALTLSSFPVRFGLERTARQ
jgi:hypothetical protein